MTLSPNAWLRYDILRRELNRANVRSFLDIGCGGGRLGARLAQKYEYVGYEPDEVSANIASKRIGVMGRVVISTLPEVPERLFDAAGAFEVLEHIENDVDILRAWSRWLVPGGLFFMSVPANPDRFAACDVLAGHYRRYTRIMLTDLIENAGLEQVRVWSIGWPLGYALEWIRNRMASGFEERPLEERTAASGRFLQPPAALGPLIAAGTLPFRLVQRATYDSEWGTGFVAMARRPFSPARSAEVGGS